ncbi:MAG: lipoyl(octanoyl) transferase LipB [Acidobacteria bacterium]|nr:lipoyl(octanoyl) transferase LipB [Acidobacteriota bacterium]
METCELRRLHLVTYENGMGMQQRLAELRQRREIPDQLLLLEHPPVVTIGRTGKREHLLADEQTLAERGIRFYETTRGGDITYHGPGQIVGYPILHLGEGRRDVRKYVERLEEVLIRTAADYGITAGRDEVNHGVWVGREKIAALGVRIAKWTTSHGFALNVSTRLADFELITPCGVEGRGVSSLERLTGRKLPLDEVRDSVVGHFGDVFERKIVERDHDIEIVKVVVTRNDAVLLLQRKNDRGGFWQPVTGRIEPGESSLDAAARELREETGLDPSGLREHPLRQSFVIDPEYLGSSAISFADERTFHLEHRGNEVVRLGPEHQRYEWVSRERVPDRIRWSDDREAIEAIGNRGRV